MTGFMFHYIFSLSLCRDVGGRMCSLEMEYEYFIEECFEGVLLCKLHTEPCPIAFDNQHANSAQCTVMTLITAHLEHSVGQNETNLYLSKL